MKTHINSLFLLPALIAVLNLIPAGWATAQTFTTLHSFTASSTNSSGVDTNSDGGPGGVLVTNSSGNTLYGTASGGGSGGAGIVFAVNTDGTSFTNLHSFTALSDVYSGTGTNSDGAYPNDLVLSGNTLYGTAPSGGIFGVGTVFKVNTDGTGFTNLHSFAALSGPNPPTNSDGFGPGGLVLSGNTLYGTAGGGARFNEGAVFAVKTDGSGFTNLHSLTFSEGYGAWVSVLSGDTLYGTAYAGGYIGGYGTVFKVNTDGTGFTVLHSFTSVGSSGNDPNSDGANPSAGLVLSGNTLYGTAINGGSYAAGTVFAVNTDGTGFTNLHSFAPVSDGSPPCGLVLSGNTLYGTGVSKFGGYGITAVFAIDTNGSGFTNVYLPPRFYSPSLEAWLVLSGNTLYGTASAGGSSAAGSVFSLSFRPQLSITPSDANVILSWPTNVAGFDYTGYTLQSTTNLGSPSVWSTNSPAPVVIAGQNTVTNPITGPQQFFRLIQ